jgi:hypothetical protein
LQELDRGRPDPEDPFLQLLMPVLEESPLPSPGLPPTTPPPETTG